MPNAAPVAGPAATDRSTAAVETRAACADPRLCVWLPLALSLQQRLQLRSPRMAKLKLDMEPDPDVTIIGISSHVNDYRLCWSINRSTGLELTRRRTDIVDQAHGVTATFSVYDHVDESTQARCTLVNNHSGDGILLKDQRQADYFLVVDNEFAQHAPGLLDRVRTAEFVLTAFQLPYEQLRAGHKLLL